MGTKLKFTKHIRQCNVITCTAIAIGFKIQFYSPLEINPPPTKHIFISQVPKRTKKKILFLDPRF